jgi:hypothetical protein
MHTLSRQWRKFLKEGVEIKIKVPFSFEPHSELNKDFWNQPEEKLDPEIRQKLLEIAQDFIDGSEAAGAPLKDITFTGVRAYFQAAKSVWNNTHDIEMLGYEVEIYGQDVKDPHTASGLYSVLNDEWIVKPDRQDPQIDHRDVEMKARDIEKQIDEVVELYEQDKYEEAIKQADRLKEKIRRFRKAGLEDVGEYSVENLAFKTLRRNGYLGILSDTKTNAYDKMMSLEK